VWVPFDERAEVVCLKEADIALMPIADGPYERAKENYKVKMYMACGLPVVCSPVGINMHFIQEGERGFFARDADEWVDAIERAGRVAVASRAHRLRGAPVCRRKV
jgi:glycosyltransferase involved in cell wall biosynthesis